MAPRRGGGGSSSGSGGSSSSGGSSDVSDIQLDSFPFLTALLVIWSIILLCSCILTAGTLTVKRFKSGFNTLRASIIFFAINYFFYVLNAGLSKRGTTVSGYYLICLALSFASSLIADTLLLTTTYSAIHHILASVSSTGRVSPMLKVGHWVAIGAIVLLGLASQGTEAAFVAGMIMDNFFISDWEYLVVYGTWVVLYFVVSIETMAITAVLFTKKHVRSQSPKASLYLFAACAILLTRNFISFIMAVLYDLRPMEWPANVIVVAEVFYGFPSLIIYSILLSLYLTYDWGNGPAGSVTRLGGMGGSSEMGVGMLKQ